MSAKLEEAFVHRAKAPGLSRRASDGIRTRKSRLERAIFGHDCFVCIEKSCK
jgi:hypothetical protein